MVTWSNTQQQQWQTWLMLRYIVAARESFAWSAKVQTICLQSFIYQMHKLDILSKVIHSATCTNTSAPRVKGEDGHNTDEATDVFRGVDYSSHQITQAATLNPNYKRQKEATCLTTRNF